MDIKSYVQEMAQRSKNAYMKSVGIKPEIKNKALSYIAELIDKNRNNIKSENTKDMNNGQKEGLSSAMLDRLLLNDKRIDAMIESLNSVISLPDPIGEVYDEKKLSNGLVIGKQRIPLGVIGMIYESRPNVTVEASSLTIKSSNAIILRGGSEAINSNKILGKIIKESLMKASLPEDMVNVIEITDRETVLHLIRMEGLVDVIIPRGGESLIKFVSENSLLPIIKHDKGVCSLFVNYDANKEMAENIAINAKVQRPGVCNAIENLYIHKDYPYKKELIEALINKGVKVKGYKEDAEITKNIERFENMDEFSVEYLDLIISVKIVDSVDEAIYMINTYGSGHSDSIVSNNYNDMMKFKDEVLSAAVYLNASTRFTDGFEFGMGAEIGISTNKLHARGPVALKELTTYKYVVLGNGQIRE